MAMPLELQGTGPVSLAAIRRLIEQGDLEGRWHTLAFLRDHSNRVRPAPNDEWLRDELFRYYVDCIRADLEGHDVVHSRYEAAGALVPLFEWLISGMQVVREPRRAWRPQLRNCFARTRNCGIVSKPVFSNMCWKFLMPSRILRTGNTIRILLTATIMR